MLGMAVFLSACSGDNVEIETLDKAQDKERERRSGVRGSVLGGEGGFQQLFKGKQEDGGGGGGGLGVNSYLWRASLDTISFMPVNSADPFGGVIITDWHAQSVAPNERFKLNVYILGRSLRADGVRFAVFRQVRGAGGWQDAPVPQGTSTSIEDAILTRARQLRSETQLQ